MIIQSSTVDLQQYHRYQQERTEKTHMRYGEAINADTLNQDGNLVTVAFEQSEQYHYRNQSRQRSDATSHITQGDQQLTHQRAELTQKLVEVSLAGEAASLANQRVFAAGNSEGVKLQGEVAFEFAHQLTIQTQSYTAMGASGKVTLEDGRNIDFSLFTSHSNFTHIAAETKARLSAQAMTDPLVINFGTESVTLSDQYFEFDLNGDGEQQNLATLGHGSGYLVLDLNGDGRVNDGSELFGTDSGNGFTDLAKYDSDGNGWIDEADPIFQQLKLWSNQSDDTQLVSLAAKGVGAIYLGNVEQSQDLLGRQGETLGQVKAAGVVLMEDGQVRSAQSIDLADRVAEADLKPERKQLFSDDQRQQVQAFAETMNHIQQTRSELQQRFNLNFNAPEPAAKPAGSDAGKEAKSFFDELFESIQKMIEARKAMLDRIERRYSA